VTGTNVTHHKHANDWETDVALIPFSAETAMLYQEQGFFGTKLEFRHLISAHGC
jgi:hypothetical protein